MSAASAAPSTTRASCSTSAAIASSPNRRRSSALWQEILPDDFIARPRLSRIYYNGKFFSYPLKAFEALLKLGLFTSAACLASYAYAKLFPVTPARTFHDWVRNQFGERLFQIFFKTYTEKVWGMSCDEISADWAAQRIKGLDLATAVINGLKRSLRFGGKSGRDDGADAGAVKTLIESFQYPRKGPGMMWEAAARQIKAQGGRILMGRELSKLEFDSARNYWRIEVATVDGERGALHGARTSSARRRCANSSSASSRRRYRSCMRARCVTATSSPSR